MNIKQLDNGIVDAYRYICGGTPTWRKNDMATTVVDFSKDQKKLLKSIDKATNGATGYLMVEKDAPDVQALYDADAIEFNNAIVDGNQVAARLKGAEDVAGFSNDEVTNESKIPVITGIPMAAAKRGGRKEEQYPFSQMNVGDSFLVPVTAAYPKPWETFASTVSSATRRFSIKSETQTKKNRKGEAIPVLVATKKFTLRRVTKGDAYPNGYVEPESGARVFRTA